MTRKGEIGKAILLQHISEKNKSDIFRIEYRNLALIFEVFLPYFIVLLIEQIKYGLYTTLLNCEIIVLNVFD